MLDLDLEDREIVVQTLRAALPRMTRPQLEAWVFEWAGFTQEETGEALGVSQQAIGQRLQSVYQIIGANVPKTL